MLFAVKLTGIGPARLWVTGFGCIQGEWLLKQGVYGDTLTLQGKTVLSTGNLFAVKVKNTYAPVLKSILNLPITLQVGG